MSIIGMSESLVHGDDLGYPAYGSQGVQVPRPPITYADDAYPDPARLLTHAAPCPEQSIPLCFPSFAA